MSHFRILILENATRALEADVSLVRAAGHDVIGAPKSTDLGDLIRGFRPDLALVHAETDDGEAGAVCRALKAQNHRSPAPLVAVWSRGLKSDAVPALVEAGADLVLERPENDAAFLAHLMALMRVRAGAVAGASIERIWAQFIQVCGGNHLLLDRSLTIRLAAPQSCRMLEAPGDSLNGLEFEAICQSSHETFLRQLRQQRPSGRAEYFLLRTRNGRTLPAGVTATSIDHGDQMLFLLTITPVRGTSSDYVDCGEDRDGESSEPIRQEMAALAGYGSSGRTDVASSIYGLSRYALRSPDHFGTLAAAYTHVLRQLVERRAYRTGYDSRAELDRIAKEMAFHRAGPRDVVELHAKALETCLDVPAPGRYRVLLEEARLALLELMGYLVNQYRTQSMPSAGTT